MFISIVTASLIISAISLIGAIFLVKSRILSHTFSNLMVGFAAGSMIAVAFLDLLPEALAACTNPEGFFLAALGGIVVFFFLERFILWYHHHHEEHVEVKPTAILVIIGDGIHNIIDGVAIAAAFLINPAVGLITTLAIAAHEIPQEIGDLSVLVHAGMPPRRALIWNFISGLTALVGAVASYFLLSSATELVPLTAAFAAGMFIYISCSDLIPELHAHFSRHANILQAIPFALGIVTMFLLGKLIAA